MTDASLHDQANDLPNPHSDSTSDAQADFEARVLNLAERWRRVERGLMRPTSGDEESYCRSCYEAATVGLAKYPESRVLEEHRLAAWLRLGGIATDALGQMPPGNNHKWLDDCFNAACDSLERFPDSQILNETKQAAQLLLGWLAPVGTEESSQWLRQCAEEAAESLHRFPLSAVLLECLAGAYMLLAINQPFASTRQVEYCGQCVSTADTGLGRLQNLEMLLYWKDAALRLQSRVAAISQAWTQSPVVAPENPQSTVTPRLGVSLSRQDSRMFGSRIQEEDARAQYELGAAAAEDWPEAPRWYAQCLASANEGLRQEPDSKPLWEWKVKALRKLRRFGHLLRADREQWQREYRLAAFEAYSRFADDCAFCEALVHAQLRQYGESGSIEDLEHASMAVAIAREAIERFPESQELWCLLAEAQTKLAWCASSDSELRRRRCASAVAIARDGLARFPENPRLWVSLCEALMEHANACEWGSSERTGSYADSLDAVTTGLARFPDEEELQLLKDRAQREWTHSLVTRVRSLWQSGHIANTISTLHQCASAAKEALARCPEASELWGYLARSEFAIAQHPATLSAESVAWYERCLESTANALHCIPSALGHHSNHELSPTSLLGIRAPACYALGTLCKADTLDKVWWYQRCIEFASDVLDRFPDDAEHWDYLLRAIEEIAAFSAEGTPEKTLWHGRLVVEADAAILRLPSDSRFWRAKAVGYWGSDRPAMALLACEAAIAAADGRDMRSEKRGMDAWGPSDIDRQTKATVSAGRPQVYFLALQILLSSESLMESELSGYAGPRTVRAAAERILVLLSGAREAWQAECTHGRRLDVLSRALTRCAWLRDPVPAIVITDAIRHVLRSRVIASKALQRPQDIEVVLAFAALLNRALQSPYGPESGDRDELKAVASEYRDALAGVLESFLGASTAGATSPPSSTAAGQPSFADRHTEGRNAATVAAEDAQSGRSSLHDAFMMGELSWLEIAIAVLQLDFRITGAGSDDFFVTVSRHQEQWLARLARDGVERSADLPHLEFFLKACARSLSLAAGAGAARVLRHDERRQLEEGVFRYLELLPSYQLRPELARGAAGEAVSGRRLGLPSLSMTGLSGMATLTEILAALPSNECWLRMYLLPQSPYESAGGEALLVMKLRRGEQPRVVLKPIVKPGQSSTSPESQRSAIPIEGIDLNVVEMQEVVASLRFNSKDAGVEGKLRLWGLLGTGQSVGEGPGQVSVRSLLAESHRRMTVELAKIGELVFADVVSASELQEQDLRIDPPLQWQKLPWLAVPVGGADQPLLVDVVRSLAIRPMAGELTDDRAPQQDSGVVLIKSSEFEFAEDPLGGTCPPPRSKLMEGLGTLLVAVLQPPKVEGVEARDRAIVRSVVEPMKNRSFAHLLGHLDWTLSQLPGGQDSSSGDIGGSATKPIGVEPDRHRLNLAPLVRHLLRNDSFTGSELCPSMVLETCRASASYGRIGGPFGGLALLLLANGAQELLAPVVDVRPGTLNQRRFWQEVYSVLSNGTPESRTLAFASVVAARRIRREHQGSIDVCNLAVSWANFVAWERLVRKGDEPNRASTSTIAAGAADADPKPKTAIRKSWWRRWFDG